METLQGKYNLRLTLKNLDSARRRTALLDAISSKFQDGCAGCRGECCTFTSNSMQLSPLEAYEIIDYLFQKNKLDKTVINSLLECRNHFHLESRHPQRGHYLRKSFTCPFYTHQEYGCALPFEIKPYGCLAFNKMNHLCQSDTELLVETEKINSEYDAKLNQHLTTTLNLDWKKAPLPIALIDLIKKLEISDCLLD